MRGSHIRANLQEIDALGAVAAEVRRRIPAAILAEVDASTSVAWLPVECDLAITRAVVDVVGVPGVRAWSRNALVRSAEGPLLRPLIQGARALFGLSPHGIYKVAPRGFAAIYRDAGSLRYTSSGPNAAKLVHTDVPEQLLAVPWYLEGIAGAFEAAYEMFHLEGRVDMDIGSDGTVVYLATWR